MLQAIKERRSAFEKEILLEELKRKLEERSKNFNMKIENLENQLRNEKKAIETLKGARIHSAYMNIQRVSEEIDLVICFRIYYRSRLLDIFF